MKKLFLLSLMLLSAAVMLAATAEKLTVSGRVTDETGKALREVAVYLKNATQKGATTDATGKYSIAACKGDTLEFIFVGRLTQRVVVTGPRLDVTMKAATPVIMDDIQIVDNNTEIETTEVFAEFDSDTGFSEATTVSEMNSNQIFTGAARPKVTFTGNARRVSGSQPQGQRAGRVVTKLRNVDPSFYVADNNIMGSDPNSVPVVTMRGSMSLPMMSVPKPPSREEYSHIKENRFVRVKKSPLSTFSLETDGASYSNARRMLNGGTMPDPASVRVEEFINYFSYNYSEPKGNDPLRIGYEVGECPWNPEHKLVSVAVKAREIPSAKLPKTNFVFLIDVSGSMYGGNRLPLVKSSLKLLVNNLRDDDRVAIVAYAGAAGEVLPSTSGGDKQKIREALDALEAGGSTAGGAGLQLAYKIAKQNFIEGGNNRVILCTDGDFNVGVSSNEGLEGLIERERRSGVFLTVLGYGMGNYKDSKLQTLAEKGNGNHAYIDNLQEANKVLVGEFGSTMYAVAKDVKLQVEFNPAAVRSYRLVGYESRLLNDEDFNDDTKDAGELGAGHTVTAFYEIVPVNSKSRTGNVDPLKYQPAEKLIFAPSSELMTVKLRYKEPEGTSSKLMETVVVERAGKPSDDFRFASAVAMFGQLLRESDFRGEATYDNVISLARTGLGDDPHGYRREFVRLAEMARGLAK